MKIIDSRALIAVIYLFATPAAYALTAPCDTTPIDRSVSSANGKYQDHKIVGISVSFSEEVVYFPSDDGVLIATEVMLPRLSLQVDASDHPEIIYSKVRDLAGKINGLDVKVSLSGSNANDLALELNGDIALEKWISMDGIECHWKSEWWGGYLECGRTEWRTRLFRHSFPWTSKSKVQEYVRDIDNSPSRNLAASRQNYDHVKDAQVSTIGSADLHISNDLERVAADAILWFASALRGDFDNFNINLPNGNVEDKYPLDIRQLIYPDEEGFVYRDNWRLIGREGYRGFWQIFVDTLHFSGAQSGYVKNGDRYLLNLTYAQDNISFNRRLKNNNTDSDQPLVDPFGKRIFCSSSKTREKVSKYVDGLVARLEGRDGAQRFSGNQQDFHRELKRKYGTTRAQKVLTGEGWVVKEGEQFSGMLPSSNEIWFSKKLTFPWDTLETYARFFDLQPHEKSCIVGTLRGGGRNQNQLRPFDYFPNCISATSESKPNVRDEILRDVDRRRGALEPLNEVQADGFAPPISNATYRGFYYCYLNPRMCSGRDQIIWWQEASKYHARDGKHGGVDLIGDDFLGSTNIFAVVDGVVHFSNRDRLGWGNALIQDFQISGVTYYAVYAHLPDSARQLNGRKVKKGESLGVTACTGNAGDGNGNCNVYCHSNGMNRTDEHLHFEVLRKGEAKNESVDPTSIIKFSIASDGQKTRYICEKSHTMPPLARNAIDDVMLVRNE